MEQEKYDELLIELKNVRVVLDQLLEAEKKREEDVMEGYAKYLETKTRMLEIKLRRLQGRKRKPEPADEGE